MTYPYPDPDIDALLADVGATPAEAQHLREVLAEAEAEEGYPEPEPAPDPYGPWDDFNAATAAMDTAHALDAQRLAEDVTDGLARRPSAEDRLQRAMRRIEAGTYTEPEQFRGDPAARDAYGHVASACGPLDEFSRCGARFHDPQCGAVIAAAAATGDAAEAEAWAAALRNRPPDPDALPYSAELAEPSGPEDTFSDLLSPHASASPAAVHARMLAVLDGQDTADPGYAALPEQMPPVTGLRTALGL
jgi:hypothetical protein